MKRRLNLLSIMFTKRKLSEVIGNVRSNSLIILVLFLIAVGVEIGIYYYLEDETRKNANSGTALTEYIKSNSDVDKQIKFFIYKYGLLNKYTKEDANSWFYYTKIQSLVAEVAPSGTLSSFNFNNTGETDFSVSFNSYEEAVPLLTALETPVFLEKFHYITLQGFDAASREATQQFTVNVKGKIILENET